MHLNLSRKWDAYRVFLAQTGLASLANSIIFTTWMLYQIELARLDALQLVLVGTVMELTIFIFEIPTGVVADVYSRRLSLIIGIYLIALAYILQGLLPVFEVILLAQVVWGFGYTFTSGAGQAWLVDEIGEARVGAAFTRASQISTLLGIPGILMSVALASVHLALPLLVGGALVMIQAVFLTLVMPETGFVPRPREERGTWGSMRDTFRDGLGAIRASPALLAILGIGLFYGLFSEAWDRLWQYHLVRNFTLPWFTPVVWFGLLEIGLLLAVLGATEVMRRRLNMTNGRSMARALFGMTLVMVLALVAYGLAPSLWVALLALVAFVVARRLVGPVYATWSNQHISSDVRATVLSMQGQMDAIGQIAGGPPLGAIGQASLRMAFVASALVLSPALLLLSRAQLRRTPDEQEASAPASGD